jgi:hypothetical protein
MSVTRTPNHAVCLSGFFEPLAKVRFAIIVMRLVLTFDFIPVHA